MTDPESDLLNSPLSPIQDRRIEKSEDEYWCVFCHGTENLHRFFYKDGFGIRRSEIVCTDCLRENKQESSELPYYSMCEVQEYTEDYERFKKLLNSL